MDEYGEPQPDREKEVAFYNVWDRTGKFPDEIKLTVDDLKASMRNSGMGLDEVIEGLTQSLLRGSHCASKTRPARSRY